MKRVHFGLLWIKTIFTVSLLLLAVLRPETARGYEGDEKSEMITCIQEIFQNRNDAILKRDDSLIKPLYNRDTKFGNWAYAHELKRMKYIHNWALKQGIRFTSIKPTLVFKSINGDAVRATVNLLCSCEYSYVYEEDAEAVNTCRIGTLHHIQLMRAGIGDQWIIMKEWYKDPFEDSLDLNKLATEGSEKQKLEQNKTEGTALPARRQKVVEYLEQYCGAAGEEQTSYRYNPKYRDYNSMGGDCANFASQALFEGGSFRKTRMWNYDHVGSTRAWVSAQGFKDYMVSSGRASVISHGSYDKVYRASYRLLPGDFVAYEKKGRITHISVVSGSDSKGYSLVTCHNTDRNKVPWDLGWSDRKIRFWLVRVHY